MVANQKPWSLILAGMEWLLKANFVAFMAISKLKLQNIVKIRPLLLYNRGYILYKKLAYFYHILKFKPRNSHGGHKIGL